ncbi:anthranilate phosphoribosyltransferase [Oscillatoria amoena NRMC-F 0135]|nr:anthranilate phosphoribosyltransferase [Oscillatoria amoena NRMC-F 0135]
MKSVLHELTEQEQLTAADARNMLVDLASGKFNPSQMAAFLTVYMMRPISVEELSGFRDAMLELCLPVKFDGPVMDVCGTGGDGKNTFNISTLAALVVAAAGQPVAKHGNYGVSSPCGSSNVLEYFGCRFTNDYDVLNRSLDQANICFMHAPLFHPAMKSVSQVRKELGVKTFFNMLGPMVNPAFPQRQLIGVFSVELARQYAYLYQQTGKRFIVLHSLDGYDEISLTGPFKYFGNTGERVATPEELGFEPVSCHAISGGETIKETADIFLRVLKNESSPQQQSVVVANAAMALVCADAHVSIPDAVMMAKDTLESGRAYQAFKRLIDVS